MSDEDGADWGFLFGLAAAFGLGRLSKGERTPAEKLKQEDVRYLRRVIRQWRPVHCESEKDYQIALQNHLLGRFSEDDLVVTREWGSGKSKIALVVEDKYGIEIKVDLTDEGESKRLTGQVAEMKNSLEGGLVVLCGHVQEDRLRRLQQEFREFDELDDLVFDVVTVPRFTSE